MMLVELRGALFLSNAVCRASAWHWSMVVSGPPLATARVLISSRDRQLVPRAVASGVQRSYALPS